MLKGQPCLNTLMGERLYVNKYAEPVMILILMFTLTDSMLLFETANIKLSASSSIEPFKNTSSSNATAFNSSRSLASPLPPVKLTLLKRVPVPSSSFIFIQKNLAKQLERTHIYPHQFLRIGKDGSMIGIPHNGPVRPLIYPHASNLSNFNRSMAANKLITHGMKLRPLSINVIKNFPVTGFVSTTTVGDTSLASNGDLVFYTGNWYAARSTDGGASWAYADPSNGMDDFCCDQDVVYDNNHDIFLWYRQGIPHSNGVNQFLLGVSNDALTWTFYSIRPTDLDRTWTNQTFDSPQLALTARFLYITSDVFDGANPPNFKHTIIQRWDLNQLSSRSSVKVMTKFLDNEFHLSPVQGAFDKMYFAVHHSNTQMYIYRWLDSSPEIRPGDTFARKIPAWTYGNPSGAPMNCPDPAPDHRDWCQHADSRILGGWIADGKVGFIWNAKQDGTYPFPHLNIAVFKDDAILDYVSSPILWSTEGAYLYGYISPPPHLVPRPLALVAQYGGGGSFPTSILGFVNLNNPTNPFEVYSVAVGTHGATEWGDYLRVRLHYPTSIVSPSWIASGYTMQTCIAFSICEDPTYYVLSP